MKLGSVILFLALLWPDAANAGPDLARVCARNKLFTANGVVAWSTPSSTSGFFYKSGMMIDADGAFQAYHPRDALGLDSLGHAGSRGNWWALVTDNGKSSGRPVRQGKSDPAPGFYVSMTALYDSDNPNPRDPHSYVDALRIPYVVLHPKALNYAQLGDFATVINLQNGKISAALVADLSAPERPVGEGSIALAKALGLNANARRGGTDRDIMYLIYPGSGNGRPRSLKDILVRTNQLFESWGGFAKLKACLEKD